MSRQIRHGSASESVTGQRNPYHGFTLIELLLVVAIIMIIAAIAVPNLLRSKELADEGSAAGSMHVILTATNVYYANYENGYPPNMASMGPPAGVPTCNQAGLLDGVIANAPNQKSGYTFGYAGVGANVPAPVGCAAPGFPGFLAVAIPIKPGVTGQRSFCLTEDGVIHFDPTGGPINTQAQCDALAALQ